MEYVTYPAIVVIVYLACQAIKATPLDNKWLPVIAGTLGAILGFAAPYVVPGFPAKDAYDAIAIGITSGFSATAVNQIYKQLKGGAE